MVFVFYVIFVVVAVICYYYYYYYSFACEGLALATSAMGVNTIQTESKTKRNERNNGIFKAAATETAAVGSDASVDSNGKR